MITARFYYNNSSHSFSGRCEMNTYICNTFGVKHTQILEHHNGSYIVLDIINNDKSTSRIGWYTKEY